MRCIDSHSNSAMRLKETSMQFTHTLLSLDGSHLARTLGRSTSRS